MKRLFIAICFLCVVQSIARAQDVTITYQQFYNELEPYGRWIQYPSYGYVWQPYFDHGAGFRPYYSGGRWVYTDYGWTWVSDYEWGWATFHYGRWLYDDYIGWLWVPGYEWAPAWVTWGNYGGYYGWAPLAPGVSISVGMGWRPPRSSWWTFVPCERFGGGDWNRYVVRNNATFANHVTIINNVYENRGASGGRPAYWMRGPKREDVERVSHRTVQPMAVNYVRRPEATRVQNNSVSFYRPQVNRNASGATLRPNRAEPLENARREPYRRDNNPGSNRPADRMNAQPPSRPGNPETPHNQAAQPPYARPGTPNPARPEQRPPNSRPESRPVNPGTRPENRPGNPPPHQENRPPLPPPPGNRPDPRPGRPMPERPPGTPPANRPGQPPGNRPMPPANRPNMPPPERHDQPPQQQNPPPYARPGRKD